MTKMNETFKMSLNYPYSKSRDLFQILKNLFFQVDEPRAPLADPWEPVNPHESCAPIKKRRKGRTSKAPAPNIVLTRTSTRSRRKATTGDDDSAKICSVEAFVAQVMANGSSKPSQVKQVS